MIDLLRPYVAPLDRDLWTFRYERKEDFRPRNQTDIQDRIGKWADRFSDPDILSGADTGPGVYVAMDPIATATWGGSDPRLYAIKIKKGTRILIGDQDQLPEDVLRSWKEISSELGCGRSSFQMYDMGHVIGFFRMNEKSICRSTMINAVHALGVQGISYSFNSAPIKDCRPTGTAISIIDSTAISLNEINAYADSGHVEGQSSVTPFVRKLFDEGKDYFYAQSLLASVKTWKRFRQGYGFFDHAPEGDNLNYRQWKAEHILKCGPVWNIETPNPAARSRMNEYQKADPQITDLLIRLSVTYVDRFRRSALTGNMTTAQFTTLRSEFSVFELKAIKDRHPGPIDYENALRFFTAQVPHWTNDREKDKAEYLDILNDCWTLYSDESKDFIQTIQGRCGMVERED